VVFSASALGGGALASTDAFLDQLMASNALTEGNGRDLAVLR